MRGNDILGVSDTPWEEYFHHASLCNIGYVLLPGIRKFLWVFVEPFLV